MDGLFLTSSRHWWEQVSNTVIESHLSVTSGSNQARTWITCLTDRDAKDCAISPPPCMTYAVKSFATVYWLHLFLHVDTLG